MLSATSRPPPPPVHAPVKLLLCILGLPCLSAPPASPFLGAGSPIVSVEMCASTTELRRESTGFWWPTEEVKERSDAPVWDGSSGLGAMSVMMDDVARSVDEEECCDGLEVYDGLPAA